VYSAANRGILQLLGRRPQKLLLQKERWRHPLRRFSVKLTRNAHFAEVTRERHAVNVNCQAVHVLRDLTSAEIEAGLHP
jgi:hypothetical protein